MKKRTRNIIIGIIIFWLMIGTAFAVSLLFGLLFIAGFIYESISGQLSKRPFLAVGLFIGGLITRAAIIMFLPSTFAAKTMADLAVAILIFLIIFLLGYRIKKGLLA